MQTSRRFLLYGLCFFLGCCMVKGVVYVPDKAINFPKCDPSKHECPANSICTEISYNYYCACFLDEKDKFFNDKDKTRITYPGGECLELCEKGQNFPCACYSGFVRRLNENGLYICANECRNDSDCPSGASCKKKKCYCKDVCKQQNGDNCITFVTLDDVCEAPSTTTRLLLTSVVSIGDTTVYTQPGTTTPQTTTPQPAPTSTTGPLLTSSVNIGDTAAYTHESAGGTHYNPFTTSTVKLSVTSRSFSPKPSEPGAPTPQPGVGTSTSSQRLTCSMGTLLPNETKCNNRICPVNKTCDPSYCCAPGYQQQSLDCIDINECTADTHNCSPDTTCRNKVGYYYCLCKEGYQKENQREFCPSTVKEENTCTDIDECGISPGICGPNLTCTNTIGSYKCDCGTGFTKLLNTCIVGNRCQINSRTNLEAKKCEKHNNMDSECTFLKSIVLITEDACKRNNTNNTVQVVASQITYLLNQTMKTLDSSDLQTVVTAITENVETSLLAAFSTDLRSQQINTSEIEADMKVPQDHCGRKSSMNLTVQGNKMEVPCSLVNFEGGGAMFISYKGLSTRFNGSILANLGDSEPIAGEEVISLVVGGVITHINTKNLDPPVTFTLKHLRAVKPLHTPLCVFWDTQEEVWSTSGCQTQHLDHTGGTRCVCTHLSTFAVLMAPTEIQVDTGLKLLSFIGLSISLVCLFLSFLTFILCRSLRSAHTSVLTVLCGCLFLGQLLVLVGLEQTWNKILCSVIAGSLQFLFLCAFCWMSLESILLFLTVRNLRAVNYMSSQRSHFPYICLIGFGIPATIMTISASLYPDIYGDQRHCWLKISHIWSFLGPVCLFISVNFILLLLTFWLLRKKLASLNSNVSTLKHTRLLTFKALSQLFILGCTWIIGLFQFGSGSLFMSYIFTICNSLQGLYIFLVHCLLNHQVREEYRRVFCRVWSKKTTSDTVSGSTLPMTIKTSQMSEVSKEVVLSSPKTKFTEN